MIGLVNSGVWEGGIVIRDYTSDYGVRREEVVPKYYSISSCLLFNNSHCKNYGDDQLKEKRTSKKLSTKLLAFILFNVSRFF